MGEQILTKKQIAQEKLEEFLQSELGDYSFTWTVELNDGYENEDKIHFSVEYTNYSQETSNNLEFYYDFTEYDLFICMHEDVYEMIRTFDWHVKYFWMQVKF